MVLVGNKYASTMDRLVLTYHSADEHSEKPRFLEREGLISYKGADFIEWVPEVLGLLNCPPLSG